MIGSGPTELSAGRKVKSMDKKALYQLSYGVFMLATKADGVANGCITNTCMQVASSPTRIAISVLNSNYTCELLKKSGKFTLSILDQECNIYTIKYWGMQSGRDVNKMEDMGLPENADGIPYLGWHACAVISGTVVEQTDLGSHTLFVAEVTDAICTSENAPLTYADYQANVKPKPEKKAESRPIVGWRCKICNYVYEGAELPADFDCPLCGHGAEDFEPIYG